MSFLKLEHSFLNLDSVTMVLVNGSWNGFTKDSVDVHFSGGKASYQDQDAATILNALNPQDLKARFKDGSTKAL